MSSIDTALASILHRRDGRVATERWQTQEYAEVEEMYIAERKTLNHCRLRHKVARPAGVHCVPPAGMSHSSDAYVYVSCCSLQDGLAHRDDLCHGRHLQHLGALVLTCRLPCGKSCARAVGKIRTDRVQGVVCKPKQSLRHVHINQVVVGIACVLAPGLVDVRSDRGLIAGTDSHGVEVTVLAATFCQDKSRNVKHQIAAANTVQY